MFISKEKLNEIDTLTQKRIEEIRSTPNTDFECKGCAYYVDNNGNDANDGLSPETAWQTLERVVQADREVIKPGDVIYFKRGCRFRGEMILNATGYTISAYGEGKKPEFFSGPRDYADEALWSKTDCENVYVCADIFPANRDIGFITINGGDIYGIKDCIQYDKDMDCTVEYVDLRPYSSYRDLNADCHFFHEWRSGKVYFYSCEGNPGKRFDSMEFSLRFHTFCTCGNDITIDNICIKHVGSHAIGSSTTKNLRVQNCEFGWVGGSVLDAAFHADGTPGTGRYGNAVEIYGWCDGFVVDNCLIYQVFDAGLTFQYATEKEGENASMENIVFSNNVILNNYYSIEYFLYVRDKDRAANPSAFENILFENNICRYSAHGMCEQRPDKVGGAHLKAKNLDNCGMNFVIRNNIFDESNVALFFHATYPLNDRHPFDVPKMEGNTYIQRATGAFGFFLDGGKPDSELNMDSSEFGQAELDYLKNLDPTGEAYIRLSEDFEIVGSDF